MIWYWKKEIVPTFWHRGTVDEFWAGDVDWLRIDGSCAHGDVHGVLLTSALTMVVDKLFIYDERSVGGTTVYFFEDQVISQRQLYVFWKLRMFQRSLDFIFPLRCLEHRSLLVNTTYSTNLTLSIWVCIERNECHVERGCGSLYPYGVQLGIGATWLSLSLR